MSKIKIEWLTDENNCETCGWNFAEGAIVTIDGDVAIELHPAAACWDGDSYSETEVYKRILAHLGHELEIV